jgi:hypothetical protein
MRYRCETTSIEGFVQQVACSYLRHGYWWYVASVIPDHKDPREIDAKLIGRYDIVRSERRRASAKRRGEANMQYIRYGRFFLLMATQGDHAFKDAERQRLRDVRRVPIKFAGYSISYRRGGRTRQGEPDPKWHAHVEIERGQYRLLRDYFLELSVHRRAESLARAFYRIEFEPYAPIRRQLLAIHRQVNRKRAQHGYEPVPIEALRLRRKVVKPFESPSLQSLIEVSGSASANSPAANPRRPDSPPDERKPQSRDFSPTND